MHYVLVGGLVCAGFLVNFNTADVIKRRQTFTLSLPGGFTLSGEQLLDTVGSQSSVVHEDPVAKL